MVTHRMLLHAQVGTVIKKTLVMLTLLTILFITQVYVIDVKRFFVWSEYSVVVVSFVSAPSK